MGSSIPKHIVNNNELKLFQNKKIEIIYGDLVKIYIYDNSNLIYTISAPYWAGHDFGITGTVEKMNCFWINQDTYGCFLEGDDVVHKLYIKLYQCKEIYIDSIYGWRGEVMDPSN